MHHPLRGMLSYMQGDVFALLGLWPAYMPVLCLHAWSQHSLLPDKSGQLKYPRMTTCLSIITVSLFFHFLWHHVSLVPTPDGLLLTSPPYQLTATEHCARCLPVPDGGVGGGRAEAQLGFCCSACKIHVEL